MTPAEQLKAIAGYDYLPHKVLLRSTSDELDRLTAENERLREACTLAAQIAHNFQCIGDPPREWCIRCRCEAALRGSEA